MSVIPDTPFNEDGWGDALSEIIYLRKQVRSLQLQLVGDSNDLNADAQGVAQATKTDSGLTAADVQALIDAANLGHFGFQAWSNTPQTLSNAILTFDQLDYDTTGGCWSGTYFTAPTAGVYRVHVSYNTNTNVTNNTSIYATLSVYDFSAGFAASFIKPSSTLEDDLAAQTGGGVNSYGATLSPRIVYNLVLKAGQVIAAQGNAISSLNIAPFTQGTISSAFKYFSVTRLLAS